MHADECKTRQTLRRIADTLGVDPAAFLDPNRFSAASETMELLGAFERILDLKDRRRCIDFVNSILARQQPATP